MKGTKRHQSTSNRFGESLFLKMATKLLLSVSIYSLIVSHFDFSFSAFSKQLLGYSINKNHMFLLCNGILIFIVKNFGAISKSPDETKNDVHGKNAMKKSDSQQKIVKFSEKKVDMEVEDEAQETEQCYSSSVVGAENVTSFAQHDDGDGEEEDEEHEQENEYLMTDRDEDEEEGIGLLSTEELNRKCDDFIRKMREVIRFEAQQLIMA